MAPERSFDHAVRSGPRAQVHRFRVHNLQHYRQIALVGKQNQVFATPSGRWNDKAVDQELSARPRIIFADPVAQWIEPPPTKRMVAGSNPARTKNPCHYAGVRFFALLHFRLRHYRIF